MNTRDEMFDETASIVGPIDAALRLVPEAAATIFEFDTFSVVEAPPGLLQDLPWPANLNTPPNSSLLDLFDPASHSQVEAARSRARLTSTAHTTVRLTAGQPAQLTLLSFGPNRTHALALIDETPALQVAEAVPETNIRTRIMCSDEGSIVSAEGPPGSYAHTDIELGDWAKNLIIKDHQPSYFEAIEAVRSGEPYASLQATGAAPGLYFGITVAALGANIVVDLHDRSHQVAALDTLRRSQEQFDQLSETLPLGVFVVHPQGRVAFASERLRELLGPSVATDFGWLESIHPDDQEIVAQVFADMHKKRHFNMEVRVRRADSQYIWARWAGSDVRNDSGELEYVVGFVEDISEWRELNSKIAYQASFDGLTDLPNRATLVEELRHRLEAQTSTAMTAVLFVDLDGFKLINDTQGHHVGDIVLLEVAQRFRRALRPLDVIGRFGGDEFVVVASDISDAEEAVAIGRRLHDILSTPVLADGRIITVNASIGVAFSESGALSSEQLIGDADIAMYEAKASGRNRSVVFDATLRARASQRFDMTADLRHARRRRELRLDYQPIIDLQTEKIIGVEALVRWDHPHLGGLSPALFIPLAEEIGLIDDVGEWVIEQACADLDHLRNCQFADDDFTISINASAQQFSNVAILATSTLASLDQYGLRPHNLRFELTESVPLTQIPDAATRIQQLTNYGFGLAIDDFGTGYSSFGYLTMLPFDVLKLDLSLTAQLEPGSAALAVVRCLTQMSTEMGFKIVAEGIETDKQQALLTDAGVQLGQGYYISRPIPLAALIELFERSR